jgi:hypothetical protein
MNNVNEEHSDVSDDEDSRRKHKKNRRRLQLNIPPITIPRRATCSRRVLCCLGYVVVLSLSCVVLLFCLVVFCHVSSRIVSYLVLLCRVVFLVLILVSSPIFHQVVSSFSISENFSVVENEDLSPRSPEEVLMGQVSVIYVGMTNTLDFFASLSPRLSSSHAWHTDTETLIFDVYQPPPKLCSF